MTLADIPGTLAGSIIPVIIVAVIALGVGLVSRVVFPPGDRRQR